MPLNLSVNRPPFATPALAVSQVPGKGRGVVAQSDIAAGAVLERCPVLVIPHADRAVADSTIIFTYLYMWESDSTEQDLYLHSGRAAIALGFASLVNHSYSPNARFERHIEALELELIAARPIRAGDEVTIDYGMSLWFDCL